MIINELAQIGLDNLKEVRHNFSPDQLIDLAVKEGEAVLADNGALMMDTGKFTGRSPKDRFIVKDELTSKSVWWGDINQPISVEHFERLYKKMTKFLEGKTVYVRDAFIGADKKYRFSVRIIGTRATHSLFCYNMFIQPTKDELANFKPDFLVIAAPEFEANPSEDGTRANNFAILNLSKKIILVGGTGYTGETKKGVFSAMNFLLPKNYHVFPMHCSANKGKKGDVAIFFGLSGTGKTTLSADENRFLIGDDEHAWSDEGIFNLEGGCYAKVINLSAEKEPLIYKAIRRGALLENTRFIPGTRTVNYADKSVTENTRVSYPLSFIENSVIPSVGGHPTNIFFLTCDAYGVLPPIARLSRAQAMYYFISGYTAKVAGTETGIIEPQSVFSACFGAPFMPLHPAEYAELLGKKMSEHRANVWLVNTGWIGGGYGVGKRIDIPYTRALITAALEGKLINSTFIKHEIFGVDIPTECEGVPSEILNPINTWKNPDEYIKAARRLAQKFVENFRKFESNASSEILSGSPLVLEQA
ncbi:MAG: phosphoenolpyruvate carboxykinase (ATP) [Cytophagales bacterium]|nr:phosphoenolpyruvate carboxykinase (ATP) [Cytophagales bacterium]MDW8384979.1 phosphoenolpyruvate carboxykinase (ATP) [Flammeovirgaceae bacterium]